MNYRRGLLRFWLCVTCAALIGVPIWMLAEQVSSINDTCFDILQLQFKDSPTPAQQSAGKEVTDPKLLAELNGTPPEKGEQYEVTDPKLLAQLNGTSPTNQDVARPPRDIPPLPPGMTLLPREPPVPILICTGTSFIEDWNRLAFEKEWPRLKAVVVKYTMDEVETVTPDKLGNYVSLYVRAKMRAKDAVMRYFFKSELPLIEGAIIILALLGWWTGRFVVYLAAWIRRGFIS
jgi:hypothetical protein